MEKRRFQNKVATSGFTLPVAASFTTLLWCAEGIYTLNRLWGWVLCAVMTYLWIETNNAYSLLRIRSRLTSAIFVFLTGCMFSLHPLQDSLFVSCLMLGSYYLIFKSYQQTNVSVCFLHTFLCGSAFGCKPAFPAAALFRTILFLVCFRLSPLVDMAFILGRSDRTDTTLLVHGRLCSLYGGNQYTEGTLLRIDKLPSFQS